MDNPYRDRQDPTFATYRARETVDLWFDSRQTGGDRLLAIPDLQEAMADTVADVGELVDRWLRYGGTADGNACRPLEPEPFMPELANVFILIGRTLRYHPWRAGDEIYVPESSLGYNPLMPSPISTNTHFSVMVYE